LNYGLNRLREFGIAPREIRATGGGSKNVVWRRILADVFNADVVCMANEEGAAVGAAVQALWAYGALSGRPESIANLCDRYIAVDESTRVKPDIERAGRYARMQQVHDGIVRDLTASFTAHRSFIIN
jgi:xylulokinase